MTIRLPHNVMPNAKGLTKKLGCRPRMDQTAEHVDSCGMCRMTDRTLAPNDGSSSGRPPLKPPPPEPESPSTPIEPAKKTNKSKWRSKAFQLPPTPKILPSTSTSTPKHKAYFANRINTKKKRKNLQSCQTSRRKYKRADRP